MLHTLNCLQYVLDIYKIDEINDIYKVVEINNIYEVV